MPGPYMQNRFGKPGTVMPRYADGLVAPVLTEVLAAAGDLHRPEEPVGLEAGRVHDDVDVVALAGDRDDAVGVDVVDPFADEFDVGALERA